VRSGIRRPRPALASGSTGLTRVPKHPPIKAANPQNGQEKLPRSLQFCDR
jgi:hypothetical protein